MEDGAVQESKREPGNRFLIVVLVILVLLIVGLGVGIGVKFLLNNSSTNSNSDMSVEEVEDNIWEEFKEDGDIDGLVEDYLIFINGALEEEQYDRATELLGALKEKLIRYNMCEEVFNVIDGLTVKVVSVEFNSFAYKTAIDAGEECGSAEMVEKYTNLYNGLGYGG